MINPKQLNSYQLYITSIDCPRTTNVKCHPLIVQTHFRGNSILLIKLLSSYNYNNNKLRSNMNICLNRVLVDRPPH